MSLIKQDLDAWLNGVNYKELNSLSYMPSEFALQFMNFIKLVNGEQGESNKTPPVHLKMLDKLAQPKDYIANLCFRGAAKTTLFMEYLTLYVAVFGEIPHLGDVPGMIYVSDSMDNGVKSARQNIEFRYYNSEFLQYWLPHAKFTDNYLEFTNKDGHRLGVKMFGAKTGLRGTKIYGKRPVLAILDDLVSDDDANSAASMQAIKDTVYKGVNHALDPTRRKVIFNGTPFNKSDILIEAVESGAWDVNVWPVCEQFPCTEAEFSGAWPDRFSYKYVKSQYDMAFNTGKLSAFYQELMLRISSEEERLIQEAEIKWYSRAKVLANMGAYNFYITTDFATSKKQRADYSVISVWAYDSEGRWYWVDGVCARQTMDVSIDNLFDFVKKYNPISVGVEVTGQQNAFIDWLKAEMLRRAIYFSFAGGTHASPGVRPTVDKLTRFNVVVPWFKMGLMHFPLEMQDSAIMGIFMGQIRLCQTSGIKGKDDCIDTISMLGYLKPWKPSTAVDDAPSSTYHEGGVWEEDEVEHAATGYSSYIV